MTTERNAQGVGVLAGRVVWIREATLRHVDEAFAIHGEHRSDWPFIAGEPTPYEDNPAHAFIPRAAVAELVAADLAFDEAVAAHGISSRWAVEANERRAAALAPFQTGGAE